MAVGILATCLVLLGLAHPSFALRPLGGHYANELTPLDGQSLSRRKIDWSQSVPKAGWANLEEEVKKLKYLTSGNHGSVYLVNDLKLKNNNVILKSLDKKKANATLRDYYESELQILQLLPKNENLCGFYRFFQDEDNLYYILENCGDSNLGDLMDKYHANHNGTLPENLACKIFKQAISGVEALHTNSLYHLGLKLSNLFYDYSTAKVKIGDFMRVLTSDEEINPRKLDTPYFPLEVRAGKSVIPSKLDVWFLGFGIYRMIVGDSFIDQTTPDPKLSKIGSYLNPGLSPELQDLLSQTFQVQEERISLQNMKDHPWFSIC